MREAFALQKLLTFFQQKYWHIWDTNVWNFNVSLTNDVVSFEQPGPAVLTKVISGDHAKVTKPPTTVTVAPAGFLLLIEARNCH